jgi:hypothetical protein
MGFILFNHLLDKLLFSTPEPYLSKKKKADAQSDKDEQEKETAEDDSEDEKEDEDRGDGDKEDLKDLQKLLFHLRHRP